jgi:predicted transcriptional regulator
LSEKIKEVNDIQDKLNKINGPEAEQVRQIFRSCLSKNKGFKGMCKISCILEGEDLVDPEGLKHLCY